MFRTFLSARGVATSTVRPRLIENQSRLYIKDVYFPLIIIWAQSTMNGRCSRETHCQGLGLLLFGSWPPFDTTEEESSRGWTDTHFVLVCFFFSFFAQKGTRISDCVWRETMFYYFGLVVLSTSCPALVHHFSPLQLSSV